MIIENNQKELHSLPAFRIYQLVSPTSEYIYISSIPSTTNKTDLLSIFKSYTIRSCYYPTHRNPFYSYSYAILSFPSNQIDTILQEVNYTHIKGISIIITKYADVQGWNSNLLTNNLYITNLPSTLTQAKFREDYSQFGQVINSKILESSNGASLQCGFVKYKDRQGYHNAKEKSSTIFTDGRFLTDYKLKAFEWIIPQSYSPYYWSRSKFWNDFDFTDYIEYDNEEALEVLEMRTINDDLIILNDDHQIAKEVIMFRAFILAEQENLLRDFQHTTLYIRLIQNTKESKRVLKKSYAMKLNKKQLHNSYMHTIIKNSTTMEKNEYGIEFEKIMFYHWTIISFNYETLAITAKNALEEYKPKYYTVKKDAIKKRIKAIEEPVNNENQYWNYQYDN